ncbi:hypothetical protein [Bacillus cereus]|uniref:hypothetical protein n=1 Tax=Bacillus cereus TaxID=1396 RepID=UPI0011A01BA4|nr:hypothetical protein [Bacillus cereus]
MDVIEAHGIANFSFYVNHLIDRGAKEEISIIKKKIQDKEIVQYIGNKYKNIVGFSPFEVNGPYSIDDINELYHRFADYIEGNEDRKYAVSTNGLCLLVALSIELLSR